MKDRILSIIIYLPNWLNSILIKFNKHSRFIYGSKYIAYKEFIKKNYKNYDNSNDLIRIVNHAIENVPYYTNRYRKISSIDEFKEQFKFIDKSIISENFEQFLSHNMNKQDYILGTTGGTGGDPLKMYIPKDRYIVELATMHTLWENVGFHNDVRAVIRNKKLKDDVDYIINPITKEIIFDGFRLNEKYFHTIYKIIKQCNVKYIHAYPSSCYEFSKFIFNKGLDISFIDSFLSSSENVYLYQKEFIEKKLGVRIYNWYGHSEKLALGGYCKHSDVYHMEPTYGFFELIDEDGKAVDTPGEIGEIVGTTLHNSGMPIIRYKTDDCAEYVGDYCEHCKRHLPLIRNIQGRRNGLKIYGADGSVTTSTALNFHDDLYMFLDGLQYIQKEKGKLDIMVIKGSEFTQEHDRRLRDYYRSKFSDDTEINIKYVDQLLRKANGKFVELISEIKE